MLANPEPVKLNSSLRLPRPGLLLRTLKSIRQRKTGQPPGWQAIIAAYGFDLLKPIQSIEGGVRSLSWLLETSEGKKILKQYKGSVEYEQIIYEHSVLQRLEQVGFPAPRVHPTLEGSTVVEMEGRYFGMFDFIEGCFQFFNYLYLPSRLKQYLDAVGQNLGRLHRALDGFTPEGYNINGFMSMTGERWRGIDWYLEKLANCRVKAEKSAIGKAHPTSIALFQHAGWIEERLRSDEEALTRANPTRGVIHGDYGVYNLLLKPGSQMVTLDFELCRLDWRLIDLVFALASVTRLDEFHTEHEKMCLIASGYQSANPMPAEELSLIPQIWTYQFLRRVIIAWERYLESGNGSVLVEAERRMARVDWVERNREVLSNLVS